MSTARSGRAPAEYDVLVAGAGPVGLALATELAWRGVRVALVDSGEDRRSTPRAKLTNVRSMEHFRRWGLAETVRRVAPLSAEYSTDICFVTRLTGFFITRFGDAFCTSTARRPEFPEPAQQIPQFLVEDVLRESFDASPLGTRIAPARLVDFEERGDGVRAELKLAGGVTTVEASYLVGCDGGRSTVRELIGGRMEGSGSLTKNMAIVFRAPGLDRLHPHGPALHYWLVNPDTSGYMGPLDGRDIWWIGATGLKEDDADPRRLLREAIGAPVELEILGLDPWQAHALVADRCRRGRAFLAGDAAHLHPPFGAHGMNLGIGDAVDLGWKLAATLAGWGGEGLLDSYESERQPLHAQIVAEAALNNERLAGFFVSGEIEADSPAGAAARAAAAEAIQYAKLREFSSLGLVLGFRLERSPLVLGDGSPAPPFSVTDYVPLARPGCLLPHRWLAGGDSLYDRLGPWFTLLVADGGDSAREAASAFSEAARRRGVPLAVLCLDEEGAGRAYAESLGEPLVLVRPDRVVAWRGLGTDPDAVLEVAVGARRCLHGAPPAERAGMQA